MDLLNDGGGVVATNELYVRPTNARVDLTTDASAYAVGEPVTVSWTDGPANRWDWIGVFRAGAADPEQDDYLLWGYTGGHDAGALPPSTEGELRAGPRPPGPAVAAAQGSVRRSLPAHGPVRERGIDDLRRALSQSVLNRSDSS